MGERLPPTKISAQRVGSGERDATEMLEREGEEAWTELTPTKRRGVEKSEGTIYRGRIVSELPYSSKFGGQRPVPRKQVTRAKVNRSCSLRCTSELNIPYNLRGTVSPTTINKYRPF